MNTRNLALILFFAIVLAGSLLLLRADEPKPEPAVYNVFSEEDELRLGAQFAEQVDHEKPLLGPGAIESYVDSLGQKLAKASRRANIPYTFKVINTATVNAFAVPGGHIYVYRGLLQVAQNEDELTSVLGHEVGHIVGRHSINHMSRYALVATVVQEAKKTGVLSDEIIAQVIQIVGGPAMMIDLAFSREEESEADLFGVYNNVRAGWDPHGAIAMFEIFQRFSGDKTLLQKLMSTHPLPRERIQNVQSEIDHMKLPSGLRHDSVAFDAMKAGMKFLPPPLPEPPEKK
jgi:predicted Zn-dependent protease